MFFYSRVWTLSLATSSSSPKMKKNLSGSWMHCWAKCYQVVYHFHPFFFYLLVSFFYLGGEIWSFLGYNGVSMLSVLPEAAQSVNLEKASPPLGSLQTTTAQTWWAWKRTRRSWANWWRPRLLRWDNSWTSILAFGHWLCHVGSSASISTSSLSRWAEERRAQVAVKSHHADKQTNCSLSPADGPASLGLSFLRGLQGSFPRRPDSHHAPPAGDPESSLAARRLPVLQRDHLWSLYPGLSHIYAGTTETGCGKTNKHWITQAA